MPLNQTEIAILKIIGDRAFSNQSDRPGLKGVRAAALLQNISQEDTDNALIILDEQNCLTADLGPASGQIELLTHGFEEYAIVNVLNYEQLLHKIGELIRDTPMVAVQVLTDDLHCSSYLADHLLDVLEAKGRIRVGMFIDTKRRVIVVHPKLNEWLNAAAGDA